MINFSALTDEALLPFLAEGEEAAFRELYDRFAALLYSFTYRKLKDREEAQDVVQEVFVSVWNNRTVLQVQDSLAAYLYKAVLNRVFNIYKHRQVLDRFRSASQFEFEPAAEGTDFRVREKDIAQLIAREIEAMPPRMQEIYRLKKQVRLSTKEIAERLELSEHTVSTQLKRAMKHLRGRLGLVIYLLYILR